uniref:Uncharacterized protein n=1 Tax=Arundo donax TaxID=35708 RepID=A0A0A9D686_ARUDO
MTYGVGAHCRRPVGLWTVPGGAAHHGRGWRQPARHSTGRKASERGDHGMGGDTTPLKGRSSRASTRRGGGGWERKAYSLAARHREHKATAAVAYAVPHLDLHPTPPCIAAAPSRLLPLPFQRHDDPPPSSSLPKARRRGRGLSP